VRTAVRLGQASMKNAGGTRRMYEQMLQFSGLSLPEELKTCGTFVERWA
jgi:hypothetical protein